MIFIHLKFLSQDKLSNFQYYFAIECRYNLFQKLACQEFFWKIILNGDYVLTPQNFDQYQDLQRRIKSLQ